MYGESESRCEDGVTEHNGGAIDNRGLTEFEQVDREYSF